MRGDQQVVIEDLAQLLKEYGALTEFPEVEALGRTIIAPLPPGSAAPAGS